jgi:diketogulonate reductase-like aldo/keto reductase
LAWLTSAPPLQKGTRLGVSEHPEDNLNVFKFRLSDADRADIEAVLDRSNGRKMITLIGDCGAEYR